MLSPWIKYKRFNFITYITQDEKKNNYINIIMYFNIKLLRGLQTDKF